MRLGLAAVFLFGAMTAQATGACQYDGQNFSVIHRAKLFKQPVAANFSGTRVACGASLSAIYDGEALTVFDGRTQTFEGRAVKRNFRRAVVVVNERFAGLYDGEALVVFDSKRRGFSQEKAAAGFNFAQGSAAKDSVSFYDGESFVVYDGKFHKKKAARKNLNTRMESTDRFTVFYDGGTLFVLDGNQLTNEPVGRTYFSTLVVGTRSVFFYDGDSLVGFCSGKRGFSKETTGFDPFTRGYLDKGSGQLAIRVGSDYYRLDPKSCRITK